MSEKQYRLNKWGTKLLKNNRPLFDWANESDDIVDLLNKQDERIKQLEQMNANLIKKYVIDFETRYPDYELCEGYTSTVEQDIRFEERTREALERVERANKKGMTVDEFLQKLDKW